MVHGSFFAFTAPEAPFVSRLASFFLSLGEAYESTLIDTVLKAVAYVPLLRISYTHLLRRLQGDQEILHDGRVASAPFMYRRYGPSLRGRNKR